MEQRSAKKNTQTIAFFKQRAKPERKRYSQEQLRESNYYEV